MSATDAATQKKMYGSGDMGNSGNSKNFTILIISNYDLNYIIKVITASEEHDILLKGTSEAIENETKEQKTDF